MHELAVPPPPMEQQSVNSGLYLYGKYLEARANQLTQLRAESALPLGVAIAVTKPDTKWSWAVLMGVAVSESTDWMDGSIARRAARIMKTETSPGGAVRDPAADKELVKGLMLGSAMRFMRCKEFGSAATVGANYVVTQWRDKRMNENRQRVIDHNLDPKQLKATKINKAKTFLQFASLDMLISPLVKRPRVRIAGLGLLSASTALGLIGEHQTRRRIDNLIAHKNVINISGATDEI